MAKKNKNKRPPKPEIEMTKDVEQFNTGIINSETGVTELERDFVNYYLSNGYNQRLAYKQAANIEDDHYASQQGSQLMKRQRVKDYIERLRQEDLIKFKIDREWLVSQYLKVVNSAVLEGEDGDGVKKDRTNWIRALKSLAEMLGLNAPQEVNVNVQTFKARFGDDIDDVDFEELDEDENDLD